MGELGGKVALITGASRGIGQAIALRLASEGASIYLAADGTEAELIDVEKSCREAGAADAAWGEHDISGSGKAEAMVAAAHERMGRVDILVNNAGIRVRKAFGEFTQEEFDRVVAINLRAPFLASQAVVPIMKAQGGGHIIHMASQLGIVASRYGSVYSLTKAGLIQLTRSMALELGRDGISVNAICPGPISTDGFLANRNPGELEQRARDVPIGRFGTVEEVAGMVAFLVSKDAAYILGHALVMDGGYVVH
ncbi:MAG: SDR family oxidoreductase [Nitrospinaceae bacterium]|jgi:NAD(P)-dependent dehydrogenase (short-subunit alcohol dehydrogenase family)|nr:SDR family oxidoreductase [Nitrospinaceae bacterium]MBT3435243.1 SDR family oxidoreductase [Nitrospinaceae bacterium]MBT3821812.1 SDR family oxidoreductase [Nitrospinaceae bacterium]MBT4092561.1 SDR family oxidoreductase [Nitrospinaceae bacterium]MBT4428878.1 SDR family oxidoreductase [Nitrospinaceae bacterium]